MKRLSLLALMLGFMLHAAAVGISANALVTDKSIKKLYLFIVQDEHYGYVQ
ncbi:MAG: TlpA family protein disulfide reductase, partial [Prevotella shahii]|nr:TlpA family protein disulfide reductase [Hoylesella shahii]